MDGSSNECRFEADHFPHFPFLLQSIVARHETTRLNVLESRLFESHSRLQLKTHQQCHRLPHLEADLVALLPRCLLEVIDQVVRVEEEELGILLREKWSFLVDEWWW